MHDARDARFDRIYADIAPENAASDRAARAEAARKATKRAAILFGFSVLTFGGGFVVLAAAGQNLGAVIPFLTSAGLAIVAAGFGGFAFVKALGTPYAGAWALPKAVLLVLANVFMTGIGLLGALLSSIQFSRGRQLRRLGAVMLPPVEDGSEWTKLAMPLEGAIAAPTREGLAAQWRENGRTEHASVAAFARLTLDLMALGAPPALVADANRDALDEIRHAELCFSLARAFDGKTESPGAFLEAARTRPRSSIRSIALAELAVDSLIDGALHEGVSARVVAKLARRCEVPAIRSMLKEIAADEGRHSRHGWDVVRFCLAEGGDAVASALEGALRGLPREMKSPLPIAAHDGEWERYGIMGHELEVAEYRAARADVVRRVTELVGARVDVAASSRPTTATRGSPEAFSAE